MRISLLSAEYPPAPGGIGDYTQKLGEALVARGHDVFIFTILDVGFTIYDLRTNQIVNHQLLNHQSNWDWRVWPAVIAALDDVRPDVLHAQYQTGAFGMHPAINFLPWRLRGLLGRPRIVVTAHDLLEPYLFPKAGPLRHFVTRRLLLDSDAVILTNQADFEQVESWISSVKERRQGDRETGRQGDKEACVHPSSFILHPFSQLIPIGSNIAVDPPSNYGRTAWREKFGFGENDITIAYFGLLGRSKGVDILVEALAQLPNNLRLIIIGGEATAPQDREYAAAVRARIVALNLEQRVIITGQVDEQTVSAHLLAADLAALPFADGASFRRGSLLATLAHGVPVVTTRSEGEAKQPRSEKSQEVSLRDSENVLLVAPGNVRELAAAIARLAADVELRKRLGEAGEVLTARFSWERIAEQHEALYADLSITQSGLTEV